MLTRPAADEYGIHFGTYIGLVAEDDAVTRIENNRSQIAALYAGLTDEQARFRYAPDKWSLKEVLGHISDTERIMSYRMLRIARGDTTPLPGFEQDLYVENANFDGCSVGQLLDNYEAVRSATLALVRSLPAEAWTRTGTASGATMSARAFAYVIAGHELHHLNILRERYLASE